MFARRFEPWVIVAVKKVDNGQARVSIGSNKPGHIGFEIPIITQLPAGHGFERILCVDDKQCGLFDRQVFVVKQSKPLYMDELGRAIPHVQFIRNCILTKLEDNPFVFNGKSHFKIGSSGQVLRTLSANQSSKLLAPPFMRLVTTCFHTHLRTRASL